MRRLSIVAVLAACGPGLAPAKFDDLAKRWAAATAAHDAKAIRAMFRDSVTNGGLWFADAACAKEFAPPGELRGPQLDDFARCVAGLGLATSTRKDALPDVVIMTSPPGFEIAARLVDGTDGAWVTWIGFAARDDGEAAPPTITAEALEQLRTAGERAPAIPSTPALEHDIEVGEHAFAWLRICLDAEGAVTARVRSASSPAAARAFTAAIEDWKFKPFQLAGKAAPVCAMVDLTNPPNAEPEKLPLVPHAVPDDVVIVPSEMLERMAGETQVAPSDDMKVEMSKAHLRRVIGAYLFCLDVTGKVADVKLVRPTGLLAYDQSLMTAIRGWTFKPYLDDGKPIATCSIATFVYTQR